MFTRSEFTIKISQEDDGSFFAEVVNLPWCFTMGETLDDINKNLKEAIIAYAKSLSIDAQKADFHFTAKDLQYA